MSLDSMVRSAAASGIPSLLRTRGKQRLMILIYHRVLVSKDFMMPGEPDAGEFDWQMELAGKAFLTAAPGRGLPAAAMTAHFLKER